HYRSVEGPMSLVIHVKFRDSESYAESSDISNLFWLSQEWELEDFPHRNSPVIHQETMIFEAPL
ncbi:hypothetical protein BgiBS90_010765, partial [Biomphalaria glabrata]